MKWLQLGSTHTEAATHTFLGAVLILFDPSHPLHAGSILRRVSHIATSIARQTSYKSQIRPADICERTC